MDITWSIILINPQEDRTEMVAEDTRGIKKRGKNIQMELRLLR